MTILLLTIILEIGAGLCPTESPPVWPERLVLVQRKVPDDQSQGNSTAVTYYEYPVANLIVITDDKNESNPLWDLELNSGHSYYYYPLTKECQKMRFPVGVLRPDWLSNATFVGAKNFLGKEVLVWTKADFIDYYADAETCAPVSWYFHSMQARFDTMYFAANATIPSPSYFEAPDYCT